MANDTSSFNGVVEQIASGTIPMIRPAMPSLVGPGGYCTPMRLNGVVAAGKVNVPVVSAVQSVLTNPTNYENSGDTVDPSEVTIVHYSAQFGFNNPDASRGFELERLLGSHLVNIEQSIVAAVNGVITETNFGAPAVAVLPAAYAVGNLETLLGAVPGRSIIALDSPYFVKTKSTWMPSGQESLLKELSNLTGIGEGVRGFAARQEAIALVYGYPAPGPVNEVATSMISLPIGLDVQFSRWWQKSGRQWRGSLDICLVAAVGQAGALKLLAEPEE